jgi:hypothetical protein
MTRRSRLWRVATAIYVFINVGGAIIAAVRGEQMHFSIHVGLLLLGMVAYPVWRLSHGMATVDQPRAQLPDARLDYLQNSVDAMALELERLGEAQRFQEKLRDQRGEASPPKKDQ